MPSKSEVGSADWVEDGAGAVSGAEAADGSVLSAAGAVDARGTGASAIAEAAIAMERRSELCSLERVKSSIVGLTIE